MLHVSFFLISFTSALLCSLVDVSVLYIYFAFYSAFILLINIRLFWEPVNSFLQSLLAYVLLAIFFYTVSSYNVNTFITSGGLLFFIIAAVAWLIPGMRFKVIRLEVQLQLLHERASEQLKVHNHDIIEKDNTITQYERLRELDKQKNNLINIAGHDLKNLVGSIIMSKNMLKEDDNELSTDQKEYLDYISQSTEKMQYILNKLMNVQQSPEMDFNPEVFDINVELKRIFKGVVENAQIKNILLIDNIFKRPIHVKLDKIFAGQVLQNLLSNSIKLAQPNNSIRVVTNVEHQKFVFEIIDEGADIGLEELDMMFNKLETLNDAPSNTESRLGLGLSIAKLITQEMGGILFYRSDDNGNYFRVEFNAID